MASPPNSVSTPFLYPDRPRAVADKKEAETKERIIELEKTQFTGSPLFADGEEFLPLDSPSLKYVGDPSPEVDSTWDKLIHCKSELKHSPT